MLLDLKLQGITNNHFCLIFTMALLQTFITIPLTTSYPDQRDLPYGSCPISSVTSSPFLVSLDLSELGRYKNCMLLSKRGHTVDFFIVA